MSGSNTPAQVAAAVAAITAAQADLVALANLSAYDAALAAVTSTGYTSGSWSTYQSVVADNVVTAQDTQAAVRRRHRRHHRGPGQPRRGPDRLQRGPGRGELGQLHHRLVEHLPGRRHRERGERIEHARPGRRRRGRDHRRPGRPRRAGPTSALTTPRWPRSPRRVTPRVRGALTRASSLTTSSPPKTPRPPSTPPPPPSPRPRPTSSRT